MGERKNGIATKELGSMDSYPWEMGELGGGVGGVFDWNG